MSTVNLDKFKYDLVEGWREVMDSKNPIDWAIFGYDGQSFDLKLVSKGIGGIDEMIDNFNSGRIMYGLCRVKIKDRNIEKIALINWQGEGAPLARKGTCANHVNTIKHFFKGVHVTINARTEEDVDPDVIRGSVGKATSAEGVCMSSSLELDQQSEPIGAPYRKLNPQEEINAKAKDDFWRKEEAEEENRKKTEKNRMAKFSQNEVKLLRKESQDYFEQEQMEKTSGASPMTSPSPPISLPASTNGDYNNGTPQSSEHTPSVGEPSPPTSPTFSSTFMTAEKAAVLKASVPRKNPSANLVRQRIKSFDANPNERPLMFNSLTANGVRASSKSPNEGEQLSVMKRKAMFESGIVSNTSQNIVRKDPAQEIKSLQEESQNQAKALAATRKSPSPQPPQQSIPASGTTAPKKQPVLSSNSVGHGLSSQAVSAASKPPQPNVKAYNLPFHIGGGVSSRLAEKVNRNTSDDVESVKSNHNGNTNGSLSSLETMATTASVPITTTTTAFVPKDVIDPHPSGVNVAATSITAEFQAEPIPQHITINFEITESTPMKAEQDKTKLNGPSDDCANLTSNADIGKEFNVSAISSTESPAIETKIGLSEETSTKKLVETPNDVEFDDTTVQSGEVKKTASPLPVPQAKDDRVVPAPIGNSFVLKPEMGLCARALYDYQAADESEITFDPGEIITNIETIDEGWWEGMGPHGVYGLFPSNYVELLN